MKWLLEKLFPPHPKDEPLKRGDLIGFSGGKLTRIIVDTEPGLRVAVKVDGEPGLAFGNTIAEALGNLLISRSEQFNIELKPGKV